MKTKATTKIKTTAKKNFTIPPLPPLEKSEAFLKTSPLLSEFCCCCCCCCWPAGFSNLLLRALNLARWRWRSGASALENNCCWPCDCCCVCCPCCYWWWCCCCFCCCCYNFGVFWLTLLIFLCCFCCCCWCDWFLYIFSALMIYFAIFTVVGIAAELFSNILLLYLNYTTVHWIVQYKYSSLYGVAVVLIILNLTHSSESYRLVIR